MMGFDAPTPVSGLSCRSAPQSWDAELVGEKIVQAFVTLDQLPKVRVPRGPRSNWPRTMVEWTDQLAQAELTENERRDRQQDANRTKICPSALEISRMETAFDWLRSLRLKDTEMAIMVTSWVSPHRSRAIDRATLHRKGLGSSDLLAEAAEGLRMAGGVAQWAGGAGVLAAAAVQIPGHARPKAMSLARRFEPRRTARRSQREFHGRHWSAEAVEERRWLRSLVRSIGKPENAP